MSKLNGTSLVVKIDGAVIGSSSACSLSINSDLPSVMNKGSQGWDQVIAGAKDWSVSTDGFLDFADTLNAGDLATTLINGTDVTVEFTTSTATHDYFYGEAKIESIEISADVEQPVTYSVSFKGNGALTKATISAS